MNNSTTLIKRYRQEGLGLVELMIAMTLSLLLSVAVINQEPLDFLNCHNFFDTA